MTLHFTLLNKITAYEDTTATDFPKEVILDYQKEIEKDYTQYASENTTKVAALSTKVIELPASPSNLLYVLTDTEISIRLNGEVDNNNLLAPSVQGVKNGIFVKRGAFTSLSFNNATSDDANVSYFIGV